MKRLGNQPIGTIAYLGGLPALLEAFCWSWGQLIQFNTEYLCGTGQYVHYDKATVSLHHYARNSLVQRFLGDWLLMLDTDHAFEPDLAVRLVTLLEDPISRAHNVGVITGIYCHRAGPRSPVLYQWNAEGTGLQPIGAWDPGANLLQVGSAGGGALLVRRWVYERITRELEVEPFELHKPFGEDHSFFYRLRQLGIPAYAAMHVESQHLEVRTFGLDDFDHTALPISERIEVEALA
jgi:hypothetical protein